MEYFACSGCRHEFFSEKAYLEHPCCARGSQSASALKKMTPLAKYEGPAVRAQVKSPEKAAQADSASGAPVDFETALQLSADARMDAKKRLIAMKNELVAAGVQCQTLNEADTKAEYEKYQQRKAAGQAAQEAQGAPAEQAVRGRRTRGA